MTSALKQPLRLKLEAQVYMNKIVGGSGYTLTEADLANIELTEPLDSHYKLSVDTETNTVFLNASRVVGTVVYLAATGSDANDGQDGRDRRSDVRAREGAAYRAAVRHGDNIISIPSASRLFPQVPRGTQRRDVVPKGIRMPMSCWRTTRIPLAILSRS